MENKVVELNKYDLQKKANYRLEIFEPKLD